MIKVTVLYPNAPEARFDHEYYRTKHLPMVAARMGTACKSYAIDKGISGIDPSAPAPYIAMSHIFCDSIQSFRASFGPHLPEIAADVPNYTNCTPTLQISEVVVG